ncbi:hypothetical protein RF11_00770 [Thelohanellus kitauei]|uniref:Uncharacterized protein n=1 Tax=Thelohanellus kitauei TaxID=669202 RepID=A0A0C2N4S9_THEKT|nr:hypothetical protein RF11_00770 [Thelohanellus kitauei]
MNIENMQDMLNSEEWRNKLEWSDCFILEEDHPWKGLNVRKRHHPLLYFNQTKKLLKDIEYQWNLCDCFQPINSFIIEEKVDDDRIFFSFKYMMSLEKITFQAENWGSLNIDTLEPELELAASDHFNNVTIKTRTIKKMNESVIFRMDNPIYFMKARIKLNRVNGQQLTNINVTFFGCSLVCGGVKTISTDILYYIQLQVYIPTTCLWYVEPARSTSIVFNILDKELDCDTSDLKISDGSKLLRVGEKESLTSFCKQGVDSLESLLYPKVWVLYTSGSSRKIYVEHFSLIYHGGCDRQYLIKEDEGYINASIHGASDIQQMKFDCSIFLRRMDKEPFVISFEDFYLFSLTKSSCTSNYVMIYSGNKEIFNIPFCDSISPPKYIDARYGWIRLKIVNSAPIYDINILIKHQLLKTFNLSLLNSTGTNNTNLFDYEATASRIIFWTVIGIVIFVTIVMVFYNKIEICLQFFKYIIKSARRRKKIRSKDLISANLDSFF